MNLESRALLVDWRTTSMREDGGERTIDHRTVEIAARSAFCTYLRRWE